MSNAESLLGLHASVAGAAVRRGGHLPSICFVAPSAYPLLAADRSVRFVGGAEVQQSLLAVELARRGYHVSMISMDYGQREGEFVHGVRVLKMYRPRAGLPVVRFFYPRMTSLWAAMCRADADIYYQRGCGALTGQVAAFARRYACVSVFAAAHDHDFLPAQPALPLHRDKLIYRWGLRHATRIVTQSERQQTMCRERFGHASTHIDSAYGHQGKPASHAGVVLWVANAKRHKQPHLFLELAARLPEHRFRMVGGAIDQADERAYFEQLEARARALPNVEMTGFVPHAEIEAQFDGASLFINTSTGEGFPNTFLQAWSRGIPTVSFFDPETRLDDLPVGVVVHGPDAMADAVQRLKSDITLWAAAGDRSRRAFERTHSVSRVVDAYERLFVHAAAGALHAS